jgi:hypothetical protein
LQKEARAKAVDWSDHALARRMLSLYEGFGGTAAESSLAPIPPSPD